MTSQDQTDRQTDGGPEGGSWHVGAAARVITPERPMRLAGYGMRTENSTGTLQDLHAKAVVFEDGVGSRAVVVGIDVLGISRELREAVEAACREEFGHPPSSLLLNASHTHFGPEYREDGWGVWGVDETHDRRARTYFDRLIDEVVGVVGEALEDLSPAQIRYSHARCGFAMNRRRPTAGYHLEQYPDGPVDHDVPVLVAEREEAVSAILFGYACHPTSLPITDQFHGDWPGVAMENLEDVYPEATAVFIQGCGADQNPYPRRKPEFTEQHGQAMTNAVRAAIDAGGTSIEGSLSTGLTETTVEFEKQPDRDALEAKLDKEDDVYARRLLDELDRDGEIRTEFPYPVQAIRFGSALTLVGLAGEVPVGYSSSIKRELQGDVWVAGYSNDGYLYVPTARQLYEGGYESTWVSLYWDYPNPLKPSVEERVVETSLALAQQVGAVRRTSSK